jgi:two-component system, chemotaxis family, response regulator WspF
VRIGIVNDLALAVEVLRRTLARKAGYELAWAAHSGEEAVANCVRDTPDLILMDLVMPGMGGVEAIRTIMRDSPCPILVVAASLNSKSANVFEAIGMGAIDAVELPTLGPDGGDLHERLLSKIEVVRRLIGDHHAPVSGSARVRAAAPRCLLAIGASAGGPAALSQLLGGLPLELPVAIVVVQHIDAQFAAGMADWLGKQCQWPVRLALEGDAPSSGTVLLAGTSDHLVLRAADRMGYVVEPANLPYRPSIDAFFESVNRHWSARAIGVLLTGMGRDGAAGLKAMRVSGHHTVAQDEATSAVYGMPRAAARLDAATDILPLSAIAPRLVQLLNRDP